MPKLTQGFYEINCNIYYGSYPANQVSGYMRMMAFKQSKPEYFNEICKTTKPFSDENCAVHLYENHALTEPELLFLQQALDKLMAVLDIQENKMVSFTAAEERLGITLPQEVKLLYMRLCQTDCFTIGAVRFLPLEELYIDEGNLVFYKAKRTPTAISLSEGFLMRYYKKEWSYSLGDVSFLQYILSTLVTNAIQKMPFMKKEVIKGTLRTVLNPREPLKEMLLGKLDILEEYFSYGGTILYNQAGTLAWFRYNGFYADIYIGGSDERFLEEIIEILRKSGSSSGF